MGHAPEIHSGNSVDTDACSTVGAASHYLLILEEIMKRIHVNALIVVCLLFCVAPAFAQYSTFVVDDNGNPATTYPTLAAAIATDLPPVVVPLFKLVLS
jgi:hypothetical protein